MLTTNKVDSHSTTIKMKIPVSFAPNITSEILNGAAAQPNLPKHEKDSPEFFFVRRNKFGSTKQFLRAMKPVVFLGRTLGVLSRNDIISKEENQSKITFATVLSACLSFFLFVNAILMLRLNIQQFKTDKTAVVRTEGFCHSAYAWVMFLVYSYQLFATLRFRKIVQSFIHANEWSHLSNHEGPETKWFHRFPHISALIVVVSMLFGITENILYDLQRFARATGVFWNTSNLQLYYIQTFAHWHDVLPSYISPITIIFVLIIKLCTWGWIYTDTISMVLCWALWEKLRIMDQCLAVDLSVTSLHHANKNKDANGEDKLFVTTGKRSKIGSLVSSKFVSRSMDDYQHEYLVLTQLVNQVEEYITPLILGNYTYSIYIIVVMIFHWIGPFAKNVLTNAQMVYVTFAFFQFCYRIGFVTYCAAEVHQMSMSIKERLHNCPNDQYSVSVERLERALHCNPAGISLFKSFMITRHYYASIIGFIFTSEIILLQTYAGYAPNQG